jgi:hypothetical protein
MAERVAGNSRRLLIRRLYYFVLVGLASTPIRDVKRKKTGVALPFSAGFDYLRSKAKPLPVYESLKGSTQVSSAGVMDS